MWTVRELAAALACGTTSSRELTEQALARIDDPAGEGARAFIKVYADTARAEALHSDALRRAGIVRSPVEGLPVAIKDLFDVGGDVTRAGSKLLAQASPAARDATAIARLRAAGAIVVGRTNMVEFAFGAVGLNPHYGTPRNPWGRSRGGDGGHVPGGSSSGAAVAQADGMCVMALGSDTRGSVRIPAALCGVVGFKPTMRRVPRDGAFPLSFILDSIGPLANSVDCCAAYDAVLSAEPRTPAAELGAKGLRLLVPTSSPLEELDAQVGAAFEGACSRLAQAGAMLVEQPVAAFDRQREYFKGGGPQGAEAYAIHRARLERLNEFDPRVGKRILLGKEISGAEFVELGLLREACMREVAALSAPFDAIIMPTVACVAPTIAEADASDENYFRWNARVLRNTGLVNFLDGCAVTLPCHAPGTAPVGLMVCGISGTDAHVLAVAAAIERALESRG